MVEVRGEVTSFARRDAPETLSLLRTVVVRVKRPARAGVGAGHHPRQVDAVDRLLSRHRRRELVGGQVRVQPGERVNAEALVTAQQRTPQPRRAAADVR